VAQLADAGCAALSYYTDMLFRSCAIVLIAGSVLATGCRAPRHRDAASSRPSAKSSVTVSRVLGNDPGEMNGTMAVFSDLFDTNSDAAKLIDAHAHYAAGVVHEMNIEPESALEDYYHAAMLDPTNEELVLGVAQQFLQAKQPDKALALLSNAATNSPGSSGLFAEMGFVYSKLGRTNEAIAADRAAIRKDPRSLAGYQSLFLDYMQNKQIPEVWDLLNEVSKVKGANANFVIGLAELYFRLGKEVPAQKQKNE